MKTSTACTRMLSWKNEDFNFLKIAKKHKKHLYHVHHSSIAHRTVLSVQTSLTRNMYVKVAIQLYYLFSKISKFRYWQLFTDTEYISNYSSAKMNQPAHKSFLFI